MISDEQAEQFVKALHEKTQRDQEPKTIILSRNPRGFEAGRFQDLSGVWCRIQKSSLATDDAIWLGVEGNGTMHLNKQMVQALLPYLEHFAETGELSNVNKGFFCANCCESFIVSPEFPVKFCAICGDEFDIIVPDEEEPPLPVQVSCPNCKGEFGIYDSIEYRRLMGSLWCPYCGYDCLEEET